MPRKSSGGPYPANWPQIAHAAKDAAGWKCLRCGEGFRPEDGFAYGVHHLDMNPANCAWWNLLSLCRRCHLRIQVKVILDRPWIFEHSAWFQPFVAGFYARKYLALDLTRAEVDARLDELLALEARAILGTAPIALEAR